MAAHAPVFFGDHADAVAGQFSYRHEIAIAVQAKWVSAHFAALKKECLEEAVLHCSLLAASSDSSDENGNRPRARVDVRLPRAGVESFMRDAAAPVAGEGIDDVLVMHSATHMEDVSRPIADTARGLAQLDDYRKRIEEMEGRADTRTEDLIKLASELSRAQSQIEEMSERRRDLDERARMELVSVDVESEAPSGGAFAPVADVWRESANIFGASVASALWFALAVVPWLAVAVVLLGAGRLALQGWRRGKAAL